MNIALLRQHISAYLQKLHDDPQHARDDLQCRTNRIITYQNWKAKRIRAITRDGLLEYLAPLWAMLIWGNKPYVIDKLIDDNTLPVLQNELSELVWGKASIDKRWDSFRKKIKGIGPAMMSELLCFAHPTQYLLWNRRAFIGFEQLGVTDLPRYNYQLTGKRYAELCDVGVKIAHEMSKLTPGKPPVDLIQVDYFLWHELQGDKILNKIHLSDKNSSLTQEAPSPEKFDTDTANFVHDEVRDKLADIGNWLGLKGHTEVKVAHGAVIDTIWETTIGNMGRVIYVFEVQTKGSIDSLLLNLLKTLNNPAVQGIVAVSDAKSLERIEKEAAAVGNLRDKLKYWDYNEVLRVHDALSSVNETINQLGLVPQGLF
jgi:hypothetical protein